LPELAESLLLAALFAGVSMDGPWRRRSGRARGWRVRAQW
jgi:hypothetical protein